jgi:ketosteroid isomerase-like protein
VTGKAAIRDLYASRSKSGTQVLSAKINSDGVAGIAPDLVYEWGTGTMVARAADGTEATRGGPYLTVWKRGADGSWRIIRNLVF